MNAEYRGKMPLSHIIQECPAADSQARYTAKLYSALSEIASSVGAISRSRPLYEGTPIPDLLVLRKSY